MNKLINNVYTIFKTELEEYNKQRAKKIELAYIGECQGFYVFAGDWQSLFLINNEGGIEIHFQKDKPKTVDDLGSRLSSDFYITAKKKYFNYKIFIQWLYEKNLLVKNIKWSNIEVIKYIQERTNKIKPFEGEILISPDTGKLCGCVIRGWSEDRFFIETYNYTDKPHIITKLNNDLYKFYLSDKKPKTQKELDIIPVLPFKKEYFEKQIKSLKRLVSEFINEKSENGKHSKYYELLLLYRAFNPNINVESISKHKFETKSLKYISFVDTVVQAYAKEKNINPYKILSEMFEQNFIDDKARVNQNKREELIKKYSYLFEK